MTFDYFVIIAPNLEIIVVDRLEDYKHTKIKYIIHCELQSFTYSKKNKYYSNKVYNYISKRIIDNNLVFDGIECMLEEKETWGSLSGSHNEILLRANIKDRLGSLSEFKFNNSNHNGHAFIELFSYLRLLNIVSTHQAAKLIQKKDKKINELIDKLNEFKYKSVS